MKKSFQLILISVFFVSVTFVYAQNGQSNNTTTPITIGETFKITSKRLNEQRTIHVYFPHSYSDTRQRFPVIYTLDGEATGSIAANAVDFMTGYSLIPQMPEALVVAVTNTDRNRDMPIPQEYSKGGQENFLAFLADELIPAIDQKYHTQPMRILIGHSQGGLFATYAMTARPQVFRWYLSLDAPLAGFPEVKSIMEKFKTVITTTPNYHGRMVTVENLYGWKKEWASATADAPKGFYGAQILIKDETHETMALKGIYEGLKSLFHDYAPNIVRDQQGHYLLPVLEQMYKAESEDYGYPVDIPKSLLLVSAEKCAAEQYGEEALALVKRAVELYGESPRSKRAMANAEEAIKKGRNPQIEEWAKLGPPDVDKMKPFLGRWEGGRGFRSAITFEVRDGVVHSKYLGYPPNGDQFELVVTFVKVIDSQTLQFGIHNGRGPGVDVYTAKLIDANTLSGTTEGVGFIHGPPPGSFTFKRQ